MSETTEHTQPLRWWDFTVALALVAVCTIGALLAVAQAPSWAPAAALPARLALSLLPLAAFALLYVTLGRRSLRSAIAGDSRPTGGRIFLTLTVVVLTWALFTQPMYALLQAVAYPLAWTVCKRYREAVLWNAAIALGVGVGMFAGKAGADVSGAALSALTKNQVIAFVLAGNQRLFCLLGTVFLAPIALAASVPRVTRCSAAKGGPSPPRHCGHCAAVISTTSQASR